MIAALTMYDRAENAGAYDRLWALIRHEARTGDIPLPNQLTRGWDEHDLWSHPDLIFGQICNLPFRQTYFDRLHIIGAMDYGLDDLDAGLYDSVIITRPEHASTDPATLRFAYNDKGSNSGWDAAHLWALARGLDLMPSLKTGGHIASLQAVAEGRADIAAIDRITFNQCLKWDAAAQSVCVIDHTAATYGMLLVTTDARLTTPLRDITNAALTGLSADDAQLLGLTKIVPVDTKSVCNLPKSPKTR